MELPTASMQRIDLSTFPCLVQSKIRLVNPMLVGEIQISPCPKSPKSICSPHLLWLRFETPANTLWSPALRGRTSGNKTKPNRDIIGYVYPTMYDLIGFVICIRLYIKMGCANTPRSKLVFSIRRQIIWAKHSGLTATSRQNHLQVADH